ncbi:unnamed protein product [Mytilus edulis]|uniref:Uncharacterized protein n=1 Tax=Mytilus edulis TaxID=6550 RepID=A0A8S3QTV8_MYTED|nr:unnamed protein product [Mytilus edulis]
MDDSEIIFNNRISDSLIEFDQDMSCPSNLMDMHVVDEVTCNTPSASASTPNYSNVERLMQNKFDDFLHQIDQMFKNTKEEMQHMTNKAMDKVDRDIAALRAQVTPPHVQSLGSGDQTHVTRNSLVDFDQRITDCNGSTFNPHMQGERTSQYLEQATNSNNMFPTQNVLFNNNNNDNLATANRWSGPSTLAPGRSSLVAGRSNSGLEAYRVADKQKTNRYRGHPINAVATNESACLDDPESFTKTFMDGFRQEMKSLTNDIKQVVKSAQSSQPGKTNDNYSNNKQWSNNYQNKGNYQNRNNNNGSGNNNRNNSYNGQTNNNSRNQNGRNDQNGNTAHNYGQGYSGNRDLSNTGAGVRQMSQGPG